MARLQIFKPGRHTATSGKVIDFTESHLQAAASAYDPAKHEAPLVIGHPKTDDPAYGWAKSLAFEGGVLAAEPHQVEPTFAEMVNAGRFKKISASFYEPDAPNNPVPGVYYVRHIGFLGAQPPSVRGLKNATFADGERGVIEFGDWNDSIVASLFRGVRDFFIEKFGKDAADKVLPDYSIAALTENAAAQPDNMTSNSYSETDMETAAERIIREAKEAKLKADQDQLARDRAEHERKTLEFAEREKAVKIAEEKTRRAGIVEFSDTLVREGKVLPRDRDGLVAYMAGPNEAGVIEFGEGTEKQTPKPGEWLRKFLAALPKQVDYTERAPRTDGDARTVTFAAPPGYSVDPEQLELHNKALAWQQQHAGTTYDAAIAAVTH